MPPGLWLEAIVLFWIISLVFWGLSLVTQRIGIERLHTAAIILMFGIFAVTMFIAQYRAWRTSSRQEKSKN